VNKEIQCPKCRELRLVPSALTNPYAYRYYILKCCHCGEFTEIDNLELSKEEEIYGMY